VAKFERRCGAILVTNQRIELSEIEKSVIKSDSDGE
jgi:hypothetical protein